MEEDERIPAQAGEETEQGTLAEDLRARLERALEENRSLAGELERLRRGEGTQGLMEELEGYRQREAMREFDTELGELKKLDPELEAQSIFDLGQTFFALRAAGVSLRTAYEAARAEQERERPEQPPEIGSLQVESAPRRESFGVEEVRRMPLKEVLKNLGKIEKSQKRWK